MSRWVVVVARRELLDLVRDRRAVFVALACALGLPPLLAIFVQVAFAVAVRNYQRDRSAAGQPAQTAPVETRWVWVRGLEQLPAGCVAQLQTQGVVLAAPPAGADAHQALAQGQVEAWLEAPEDLALGLADLGRTPSFTILYDGTSSRSDATRWVVYLGLVRWREVLVSARLEERGLRRGSLTPLIVNSEDVRAPPPTPATSFAERQDQAQLSDALGGGGRTLAENAARTREFMGALAALILCITALVACVPAATSMGVLERERGTLEALLLTPAPRTAIALGKTLALAVSALALCGLTTLSSLLTVSPVALQARTAEDPALRLFYSSLDVPLEAVLAAMVLLIPFVVFASAGTLAIAATIRSEREGGYLLGPLLIVALLLLLVGCLPPSEGIFPVSDAFMALIPFAGMAALVRALLAGTAVPLMFSNALLSILLCAILTVRYVARVYDREEAVLRAAASPGFGVFDRQNEPDAQGRILPTPAQGLFLAFLVLILEWVVGGSLQALGVQRGLVATGGLVLFALPLAYGVALGVHLRPSFGLSAAPARTLVAGALLGLATPVLATDVFALQALLTGELLPEEAAAYERLLREVTAGGGLQAFLIVALLPGVLEELVFRGFLLSGVRRWGAPRAVATSAVMFALVHLDPARFGVTGLLGALFAVVTLRSGSALPAMLAHTCHNGLAALGGLVALEARGLLVHGQPTWTARGAALALVAGALALAFSARAPAPGSPAAGAA